MLVVFAAGEIDVAGGGDVAGGFVVGEGVGAEDVVAVGEDSAAGGGGYVAVFGLQIAFEDGGLGRLGGRQEIGARDGGEIGRGGLGCVLIWDGSAGGFLRRYALSEQMWMTRG